MSISYQDLCLKTCETARSAGAFIAGERKGFQQNMIEYKGLHDLVSYVDREAEQLIIKALSELLTGSGFIAEEGTNNQQGEVYNWIIDPLDGTTNFIQGIPVYSVSIALMEYNEPVLGVVYEIGQDECFYAWKDGGAWLNGNPIQVSVCADIHGALLATGFPYSNFDKLDDYLCFLKWAMRNSRGVRRIGSAAVDLAYVACGRFDAFWEYDLKPWDVAAGVVLVKEAGGQLSAFDGTEDYIFGRTILATNPRLEQIIKEQINLYLA
jgi:myo-inositol-1(or 4)-monophosphatase